MPSAYVTNNTERKRQSVLAARAAKRAKGTQLRATTPAALQQARDTSNRADLRATVEQKRHEVRQALSDREKGRRKTIVSDEQLLDIELVALLRLAIPVESPVPSGAGRSVQQQPAKAASKKNSPPKIPSKGAGKKNSSPVEALVKHHHGRTGTLGKKLLSAVKEAV